jgi:hypothetical protein
MSTLQSTKSKIGGFGYEIVPGGPYAGQPAVFLSFEGENPGIQPHFIDGKGIYAGNNQSVSAILKIWAKYGWRRRLESGSCPLIATGHAPLGEENAKSLQLLIGALSTAEICVETGPENVSDRSINMDIDHYIVRFAPDEQYLGDEESQTRKNLREYASMSRVGSVDFDFVIETQADADLAKQITSEYRIPYDRVWLTPHGDTPEAFESAVEVGREAAKTNIWRFSHREFTGNSNN